jgi:hypothetical protein
MARDLRTIAMFWDFRASRITICADELEIRLFELLELLSLFGDFLLVATNPKRASIRLSSTLKH